MRFTGRLLLTVGLTDGAIHVEDDLVNRSRSTAVTNPDPKVVRFGQRTWDEMMIGWFTAVTPEPEAEASGSTSGLETTSTR